MRSAILIDSPRSSISKWDHVDRIIRGHKSALVVFSASAMLFVALATIVIANPSWLAAVDTAVTTEVAGTHNGTLNRAMRLITLLGNRIVIGALLIGLTAWVLRTGRCRTPVLVLVAAFLVNPILEAALKGLVGRSRPEIAQLVSGDGPAFPSGHVLATVGFYGVLAVIAWRSTARRSLAIGALLSSSVVIALVGFSRIYLGVHWMSDVIGGLLVGSTFVLGAAYFLNDHHFGAGRSCSAFRHADGQRHLVRVPSSRAR